jgi:hypothetical protein
LTGTARNTKDEDHIAKIFICIILVIGYFIWPTPVSAQVIHIGQGDRVYYNDTVDLRGITGWTDTIAWWSVTRDPSTDEPNHKIVITKFERFNITRDLEAGMWYQWYGKNERSPVMVFYVVPRERSPAEIPTPTPTPEPTPTKAVNPQPNPIADYLVARHDEFYYGCTGPCKIWLFGPGQFILGADANESTAININLGSGGYTMIRQYPDANGVFEIYSDGETIFSAWKDVPDIWADGFAASVILEKVMPYFNDAAHFHGYRDIKKVIIENQRADITGIDVISNSSIFVSGITNLAKGDIVTVIFDENRSWLAEDRAEHTFVANVTGDDPGAYRLWKVAMDVGLQQLESGNHYVSTYTPDGTKVMAPFYLAEAFKPFETPQTHFKYINNSPFIPTPTPEIIREVVTREVTVVRTNTIYVNITPDYQKIVEGELARIGSFAAIILIYCLIIGSIGYASYSGWRVYAKRKNARNKKDYDDLFGERL